jgi:RNA polymerase sigma-70 factor, ECF subfamily
LPSDEDVEGRSQTRERRRLVRQVLAEMSESMASVVMLRDLQGLSYEEIAAFFELPVGTIKSRLHRARAELVQRVGKRLDLAAPMAAAMPAGGVTPC